MKLAGVVVVYNPTENLNKKIKTYLKKIDILYVIDNSLEDHSKQMIKSQKIKYIPNRQNLGIAVALNKGAKLAYQEGYHWLLTMDQDSEFEQDNLEKLIQYVKTCDRNKVGIVSPWHVTKEHKIKSKEKIEQVVEVMTSGNLVNLDAWKKVGGWKDWFFIDCVDIEFCMNLKKHGYQIIRYNEAVLIHNLGNITLHHVLKKEFACTNHNFIRQYYMIRNMYYLKELYQNDFPDQIKAMQRGAFGRFKNILVWEKDKYRKIRNMYRGYRDYKRRIKGKYPYVN